MIRLRAKLRSPAAGDQARDAVRELGLHDGLALETLLAALAGEGVPFPAESAWADAAAGALEHLGRRQLVDFHLADPANGIVLSPCSAGFALAAIPRIEEGRWKLSRFAYLHVDEGRFVARTPLADCYLALADPRARALLVALDGPQEAAGLAQGDTNAFSAAAALGLFARAGLILSCDGAGTTSEERDDAARQWDFHELLFHAQSRLGRTEKPIGGTYSFHGVIPPQPAVKAIPEAWAETVHALPRADVAALMATDLPLTAALERRRSIRQHGIVPPSAAELGELLFRAARIRSEFVNELGDFTSRPYPGGGACYELEIYVTIEACRDLPRGFYYYDPRAHRLCRISGPSADTEGLLADAYRSTAGQGRPQILLTLASRFNRFNWKYRGMAYAAQLKNVGVVYQTLYLIATAMGLAPCALGLGDTDRFCRMTGLPYLSEGSIGEFMLGSALPTTDGA
jgi:SagB-type dehydrogenase family enzyme